MNIKEMKQDFDYITYFICDKMHLDKGELEFNEDYVGEDCLNVKYKDKNSSFSLFYTTLEEKTIGDFDIYFKDSPVNHQYS